MRTRPNQIKQNLEYFGLNINALYDGFNVCDIKYMDYLQDQTNVIHCDINVNDLSSYQDCLHNVTHKILDIA